MSFSGKSPGSTYKDLLYVDNNNSGVSATAKQIKTAEGSSTVAKLSDRSLTLQPTADNDSVVKVSNASGAIKFQVDTSANDVKALGTHVNTQYANFGINAVDSQWASAVDDTHHMVPYTTAFANVSLDTAANLAIGTSTTSSFNDTEPADSLTIATTAQTVLPCYWYVPDAISIDKVEWFTTTDAAAGSNVCAYLMAYDLDKGNTATSGDLSNGTKLASSGTIANNGYEQIHYNNMTIHSSTVTAGKVILFTFAFDDTEASDYGISATIKYHLT
tara:strand:+ start:974 stop:1795 length:822 start_codon:yes stop_codon:yes gene_type:complete